MESLIVVCSIRAAFMAAGIAVTLKLLRIKSAPARHHAWNGLLIVMLLLPIWSIWGPTLSVPLLPSRGDSIAPTAYPAQDYTPNPSNVQVTKVMRPAQSTMITPSAEPSVESWELRQILLIGYFAGVLIMAIRLSVGTIQAWSLKRRAITDDEILVSSHCAVPVTLGLLRPVVILPQNWRSWSETKLDAVLIHEREHIWRRDPLIKWLAQLNRTIFWFHPLAWWLERKLSILAEDACDAAVIARGHRPQDYSQYLIDLARDVGRTGARISFVGASIGGGLLDNRIRRILEIRPQPAISRRRAVITALLCLSILTLCASCQFRRASTLAPNQQSMNAMMHDNAEKSINFEKRRQAMEVEAKTMTAEQAVDLEAEVKNIPEIPREQSNTEQREQDWVKRTKLVRYYQRHKDYAKIDELTLWHIEHRPMSDWVWKIDPASNPTGYATGKTLWLEYLKKPDLSVTTYRKAAAFLEAGDKPLAEEILLTGLKDASKSSLKSDLCQLYALALIGAVGPRGEGNDIRDLRMAEAHGPYAQTLMQKLATTTDVALLTGTSTWVINWSLNHYLFQKFDFDILALADSINKRALEIEPTNHTALATKVRLNDVSNNLRLRSRPFDQLNRTDRMRVLCNSIQLWSVANKPDEAEAKARQLLELAMQDTRDPQYGDAIYAANIALGYIAWQKGDKTQASRHLLSAVEAPPSDRLRVNQIDMTLARRLVDLGERDAVAQFLEKCANFNWRGKELSDWATNIRKGINPDLKPYQSI